MKKVFLYLCIGACFLFLVNASVWEGAAEESEDLPVNGRYIATNSFPANTVVDVTNLENGNTAKLIVHSGLESSGFLAMLSKDAAGAIGMESGSLIRIRMIQDADPLAYSRFMMDYNLTMIPADPRPPEGGHEPDPASFISSSKPEETAPLIAVIPETPPPVSTTKEPVYIIDPAFIIDPIREPEKPQVFSSFSAPLIYSLECGMYYVQVAAYSRAESAENELSRIDNTLPMAIMSAGTVDKPLYRVLIGPVNLGESGAILQRYKSIYNDAFVRQGT